MARNQRPIVVKQGLALWVMTYGDMMSLLLTFFVLIVSFSSMQEAKFNEAAASLRQAFGVLSAPSTVVEFNEPMVPPSRSDVDAEVAFEVQELERSLLAEDMANAVEIEMNENGVEFRISAPFLFPSGGADLQMDRTGVLAKLATLFRKFPYEIEVEGHTDSIPISTSRYPSNWDLSAGRAVAVARYFQGLEVPPDRISATGFGEFRPIADNATAEGRSRNRRVEIFLKLDRADLVRKPLPLQDIEVEPERVGIDSNLEGPVTSRLRSRQGER